MGIARFQKQKKNTKVESQWRTLFRIMRGEMTPQLHSRISKRELTKEFDDLIEEMELLRLRPKRGGDAQSGPDDLCRTRAGMAEYRHLSALMSLEFVHW